MCNGPKTVWLLFRTIPAGGQEALTGHGVITQLVGIYATRELMHEARKAQEKRDLSLHKERLALNIACPFMTYKEVQVEQDEKCPTCGQRRP